MYQVRFFNNISYEEIEAVRVLFYRLGRENFWKILMLLNKKSHLSQKEISEMINNHEIHTDLMFMTHLRIIDRTNYNENDSRDYTYRYFLNYDNPDKFDATTKDYLKNIVEQKISGVLKTEEELKEILKFAPRKRKK